jgi:hypothetical protein
MRHRSIRLATCLFFALAATPSAQPIPVSYVVRLTSATVYDTRSRDEDTVHASLTVFVNGERKAASIWDGKSWDGSRVEGRSWVTGLHIFGTPADNTLHVSTGKLQESDTLQIVFAILNMAAPLSAERHQSVADRVQQSACAGGDGATAWDCLAPDAAKIVAGLPIAGCDGLVAADKLIYTAMQLRRKTETGDTVAATNVYRGSDAPPVCGNSIYGATITIARE